MSNSLYPERHDLPQIPWAKKVKVTGGHYWASSGKLDSVEMKIEKPWTKASIIANGTVHLDVDSKENIRNHMVKSRELTRSLLRYCKKSGCDPSDSFYSIAEDWVKGTAVVDPPWGSNIPGVMDWFPGVKEEPKIGKRGSYGEGQINKVLDNWIGTQFNFLHFVRPDEEEGFVINWGGDSKVEVWLGDVEGFVSENEAPLQEWEDYRSYNELFENGFLWALDHMGVFETNKIPRWAVDIIDDDPDLLWAELVQKLLPIGEYLPAGLDRAIAVWMDRRRREAEESSGQQRFWPRGEA